RPAAHLDPGDRDEGRSVPVDDLPRRSGDHHRPPRPDAPHRRTLRQDRGAPAGRVRRERGETTTCTRAAPHPCPDSSLPGEIMSSTNGGPSTETPVATPGRTDVLRKLVIWLLFFLLVYLIRDFFFTAFMTFLFCYLTLAVVGWCMKKLSPDRERPGLRRLLTVAVFVLVPLILLGIGILVAPRLLEQGQHLAGWLSHVTLESEAAR